MQNTVFLTILDVLRELTLAAVYLGAAFLSFTILKQDRVKNWLGANSKLLSVVIFVILTSLLYSAASFIISDFFFIPRQLVQGELFRASIDCLGSLLTLAGLVVGIVLIVRTKKNNKTD